MFRLPLCACLTKSSFLVPSIVIMESFRNFEHKFEYSIIGHSGDSPNLEFVKPGRYPKTEKDVFKVISQMSAHSQYCLSGDNTLSATSNAMREIVKEDADDYIVVVLSDANIGQYNIKPEDLGRSKSLSPLQTMCFMFFAWITFLISLTFIHAVL